MAFRSVLLPFFFTRSEIFFYFPGFGGSQQVLPGFPDSCVSDCFVWMCADGVHGWSGVLWEVEGVWINRRRGD